MGILKKIFHKKKKEVDDADSSSTPISSTIAVTRAASTVAPTVSPSSKHDGTSNGLPPIHPPSSIANGSAFVATGNSMLQQTDNDTWQQQQADAQAKQSILLSNKFASYASGASTPDAHSEDDDDDDVAASKNGAVAMSGSRPPMASTNNKHNAVSQSMATTPSAFLASSSNNTNNNPKSLSHSLSAIRLDEMIEDRRDKGDLSQNIVHFEVPFGKPIEEVYDGVHTGSVLGSGISGLVRLVTHKATGIKYAVKVLDLGLVDSTEGLEQLREEIFIMCQLDHPNIVRLEEVYESQSEIYLVQELCLGGELFDRLDEQPDYHYTEAECAKLVKQMLCAVRYLHSRGIIHRDLKLENFLFSSTAQDSELKMIDFGLSKHFRYGEIHHEAVGTPYTVAPEVIKGNYDEKCDTWAVGVIAFLLLSGEPPFGGCGGPEPLMMVRSNILNGVYVFEPEDIWASVSALAREFIKSMLQTAPDGRPTAKEAQKHQWLIEWASRNRHENDNVLSPNVVKALVNFKEYSDMRKLLCEVLSFTLLPYQIKDLRQEFEKMDTDGSGEISLVALKQVLMTNAGAGSLGALTEEEVEDIFNAMRVVKTETRIHWHEFIAAGLSQCQVDDRNLRLAFERLDSDHKGYLTVEDIMDVMGSDAVQREDAVRTMWGDSVKAVKCQHARITYDDFLLLMKGQTKEPTITAPTVATTPMDLETSVNSLIGGPTRLDVVPEVSMSADADDDSVAIHDAVKLISDDDVVAVKNSVEANADVTMGLDLVSAMDLSSTIRTTKSAPSTPADHKRILELGMDDMNSPLSMDDDDGVYSSGPGIPGSSASLTPPMSPARGAQDYCTPSSAGRHMVDFLDIKSKGLLLPGLPAAAAPGIPKPLLYERRRSRSMDESDKGETLHAVADVVKDMLLPEAHAHLAATAAVFTEPLVISPLQQQALKNGQGGPQTSALVVNRKLYRAHRTMRLGVLEASKRFEEQQARHARDVILAQRDADEGESGGVPMMAGLVMRHGNKKQVSSKAIRNMLEEGLARHQSLVEKANKRSGRGRRSRKKTMSDMAGMMMSMGQDELGEVVKESMVSNSARTLSIKESSSHSIETSAADAVAMYEDIVQTNPPVPSSSCGSGVDGDGLAKECEQLRGATVPGEFRKTSDPFGKAGKYGAQIDWK